MEYLCNKIMNLIMYEPNIYINNNKFISLIMSIMSAFFNYLRDLGGPFYIIENLSKIDGL